MKSFVVATTGNGHLRLRIFLIQSLGLRDRIRQIDPSHRIILGLEAHRERSSGVIGEPDQECTRPKPKPDLLKEVAGGPLQASTEVGLKSPHELRD
jgi:hypothetical protein